MNLPSHLGWKCPECFTIWGSAVIHCLHCPVAKEEPEEPVQSEEPLSEALCCMCKGTLEDLDMAEHTMRLEWLKKHNFIPKSSSKKKRNK